MSDLRPGFKLTRQCSECPWRKDVPVGRFPPERYVALKNTVEQGLNNLFACHKTSDGEPSACVGFLLVDGPNNWTARLAAITGEFDPRKLEAAGPLYDSFQEMALANGVSPEDLVSDEQREVERRSIAMLEEAARMRREIRPVTRKAKRRGKARRKK